MRKKQQPLTTYEAVKEKAFRLLEYRAHTEKELADKLRRLDASEEHIDETLSLCRRYGFLNDEAYAKRKAKDLFNLKKYGIRRIRQELKMKGIADEYIDSAVAELDTEDEQQTLIRLTEKKLNGDFSEKSRNRCIRYLMYRGYDLYSVKDAIRQLEDEYEA